MYVQVVKGDKKISSFIEDGWKRLMIKVKEDELEWLRKSYVRWYKNKAKRTWLCVKGYIRVWYLGMIKS